jgi:nucleoid-associated protein YgaU
VEKLEPEAAFYTVQRGDMLSKIARKYYGNAS